jgi:hypothetical protein
MARRRSSLSLRVDPQAEKLNTLLEDTSRPGRSIGFGKERVRLTIGLAGASFEDASRAFEDLLAQGLRAARSARERRELQRRIAEDLLMAADSRKCAWEQFGGCLKRLERLGYTNVERRLVAAAIFVRWARKCDAAREKQAREMLTEAERRVRCLPSNHPRRASLEAMASSLR